MRSPVAGSNGKVQVIILVLLPLILLLGAVVGLTYLGSIQGDNVLTENLAEPLNGATSAKIDINAGDGNLTIDWLTGGEPLLAGGTLQYFENQGLPTRTLVSFLDQATLTLKRGDAGQPWLRLPWAACNGATEWQIHLNPTVSSDIIAHSDGGSVKLDLAGMTVTRVSADTGGGNVDVVLPDDASGLSVKASTGAGNVVVLVPSGIAAKIHAASGLGKVIVDPRFGQTDDNTYQSSDYDGAAHKAEIMVNSGAGNVVVNTK